MQRALGSRHARRFHRLTEEVPGTSGGTGDPGDQDEPTDPTGGTAGGLTPYTYATDSHRLLDVGGTPRSYDAAGNTTQVDNQTLVYNATGRLSEVREGALTVATYAYNGRGERVQKTTGGLAKTFVYNERGQLLGEYSAMGFVEYLWFDDLLVGVSTIDGLHRIETDHLGTPRIAKGQYGNTTWRWAIEDNAFGQMPAETIGDGDSPGLELNLRFPGQYFDQETGLHYNYFRDYEPQTGRYVQSDPIGLDGGLNTYSYALQNPIIYSDTKGLDPFDISGPSGCVGVSCICLFIDCDAPTPTASDIIRMAASGIANNCEIHCSVRCVAAAVQGEVVGRARDFALQRAAQKTASQLVKKGVAFTLRNVVPVLNIYGPFKDFECVATCVLTGG